jgi:hypothetical protein
MRLSAIVFFIFCKNLLLKSSNSAVPKTLKRPDIYNFN